VGSRGFAPRSLVRLLFFDWSASVSLARSSEAGTANAAVKSSLFNVRLFRAFSRKASNARASETLALQSFQ